MSKTEKDEIIIQSILDAAKVLIQQHGLNKTTMEDIAKGAKKGRSTLYYYFKNKEEIFDQVIQQEIAEFFQTVSTEVKKQEDALAMLRTYIITRIKILKRKVNLYRFVIEGDLQSDISKEFANLRKRYDVEEKKLLTFILTSGVTSKLFRTDLEKEMDILSELLVTLVRGVEMEVITQYKYGELADKADFLVSILVKGIGK